MNLHKPDEETFLSRMEGNTKILIVIQEFYLYRINIYGAILA